MKKRILATLMALCLLIFPITVSAKGIPFLALGKDLNDEQLEYVLSEMGISKDDLENYTVVYITNDMEHEMLDSYIDPSVIGSHSLSSVMVKKNEEGYGIRVTTKNINYCTISMYQNALLTAGVEDADVLVVGPYPISGTAALVGAWMAYEEMSGEKLPEEAKEAALAEMITTGELTDGLDEVDKEKVQDLIDYVKAEVISQGLTDADDIEDIIAKAQEKFGITLTEDQIKSLIDVMKMISNLDIDPKKLLEQAGDLYNKYGDTVLSEAKKALDGIITDEVKMTFWAGLKNFFATLFKSIKDYLQSGN
ncbi:MAG: DUF1002 domain-containing protein [Lachnospiraceae bacterium]|nr:DUF1002 domain-containing protein [Lachnospiraceae bacterium]